MTAIRKVSEPPQIPDFEGKEVHTAKIKVNTTTALEFDAVVRMDDIVRVVVEARVNDVSHKVNERHGTLERIQSLRVLNVDIAPWDEDDPEDTGIIHD